MSKFKRCKVLSYARVTNADYVNSYYRALLDQEKSDRLSFFNANILPILKRRDVEAFSGFNITADCIDQLCEVEFIAPSTESWWETPLVGGLMFRNKDDIKTLN